MSEVIRLYKYQALLSSRRALSRAEFMALLEVSPATFKRDLAVESQPKLSQFRSFTR